MAIFNPIRGTLQDINNTPVSDGQFLFVTDQDEGKNSVFIDVGLNRIEIGAFDWSKILNKPFVTIGSHLTVDSNNVLSADIQTWSEILNKPFVTIGDGLAVNADDELIADIGWLDVPNKPFVSIGSHLTVDENNILSADIQTWSEILNKPFVSIGARLTVNSNNVLSADIQNWSEITSKPFTSIGEGLTVINGELCATGGGTGVDWATEVVNKPFETIGSSFTVSSSGVLNLNNINWNIISNKPFTTIGSGLNVDSNNVLSASISWGDVTNKPFTAVGSGLNIDSNNVLSASIGWTNVITKPFTTIGSGLSVSNNVLSADIQTVTAPTTGTASDTGIRSQKLTIGGNSPATAEINGTAYMQYSQTIEAGLITSYIFTNNAISSSSIIDVYTNVWGLLPASVVINGNVCTVNFTSATTISDVICRIYIK